MIELLWAAGGSSWSGHLKLASQIFSPKQSLAVGVTQSQPAFFAEEHEGWKSSNAESTDRGFQPLGHRQEFFLPAKNEN
jgi:hypothetical protein